MNTKIFKNKSKQEEFDLKNQNSEEFHVKIQCPDCGSIFIFDKEENYFCKKCKKMYTEHEIRARCGL